MPPRITEVYTTEGTLSLRSYYEALDLPDAMKNKCCWTKLANALCKENLRISRTHTDPETQARPPLSWRSCAS